MNLKRILVLISIISVLIFTFISGVVSYFTVSNTLKNITDETSLTLSASVAASVVEPLRQGAFLEARNRIGIFLRQGLFECAELQYEGMPIAKCDQNTDQLTRFDVPLEIYPNVSPSKLSLYVNRKNLENVAIEKSLGTMVLVNIFGLIFLGLMVFGIRKFGNEILKVSSDIDSPIELHGESFIEEINIVRQKLFELFQLRSREVEVSARMQFSKQIAHDIRSPLGALFLALRGVENIPTENRLLLENASNRIKSIADDLLKYGEEVNTRSYMKAARTQIMSSHFSVNEVINNIIEEKKVIANLDIAMITKGHLRVSGDKFLFQRILSNLLDNAIEAKNSTRCLSVKISASERKNQIVISIQDNGRGIPEEILSRIGERGFSYGKPDGNGLGVSFAKETIQSWGGDLHISSKSGIGTLVSIILNKAESPSELAVNNKYASVQI